jgi:hypothetical protein
MPEHTVVNTSHHGAANTPLRRLTKRCQKPKPDSCCVNHLAAAAGYGSSEH